MKKILIPVDSSEFSERAIEEGKRMAAAFGSEVVLVSVVGVRLINQRFSKEVPKPDTDEVYRNFEKVSTGEMLEAYKDSFGDLKDKVKTQVLFGRIDDEIIKAINNTDVDLVIMGSHGIGSTLYRNLLGSTTNKVLHHSNKPVLVVR